MKKYDEFGELMESEIREYWSNEAADFTPWLAENIELLGDALDMELAVEQTERNVGQFRVDILCRDINSERWVVVENQLEQTNHRHLGQLLTYAAGLGAGTVIWIADKFNPEHRAALDWLNAQTNEDTNFFGVEIEVWRIGDSAAAPRLEVVAKPNNWTKSARAIEGADLSDVQKMHMAFWQGLFEFMHAHDYAVRHNGRVVTQGIKRFNFRGRNSRLLAVCNGVTHKHKASVNFRLFGSDAAARYRRLEEDKTTIEQEIGARLIWHGQPRGQSRRIGLRKDDSNFMDKKQWPQLYEWIATHLDKFHQTFEPRIENLEASDDAEDED
ncbi:MAG: DUF4268 domain-containing protein [bacterium]